MPVNDKIRQADYNNIRNKVINVLGAGSGNSGYGQTVQSTAVAEGFKVSRADWGRLRWDIINAYRHIFGVNPVTVNPQEGNLIRYDTDFAPSSDMALEAPVTQYNTYADQLIANRLTVHPSQAATQAATPGSTSWPGIYGNFWNVRISCTVTVSWTSAAAARYFFNTGGQIRIASSRTGGSSTTQCTSWTNILSSASTQTFSATLPNSGIDPNDGTNYFRCSDVYQLWYSVSGSSPYGGNTYRISARTPGIVDNSNGTASSVQFLLEYIDNYVDPGTVIQPGEAAPRDPADFPPGDAVDGTFSVAVSYLYATGVLDPPGTGNFAVEQPTVTIGAIAP